MAKLKSAQVAKTMIALNPAELVTAEVMEAVTGYSLKAMDRKREDGVWPEGEVWIKAPDGRILYDLPGYYRWSRQLNRSPSVVNSKVEQEVNADESLVYVIQQANTGVVKVGIVASERRLYARLSSLQTGSPFPLKLLHKFKGSPLQEEWAHEVLDAFRLTGEWFEGTEEVLSLFRRAEEIGLSEALRERRNAQAAVGTQ